MTYEEYIASSKWKALRLLALEHDGHMCRICSATETLEVHHCRYPPLGQWHLDSVRNLTTLCAGCHDHNTNLLRGRRYAKITHVATDVNRITPAIEVNREQLQGIELQDYGRRTVAYEQWPDRRSLEPPLQEHRRNYEQAKED